MLYKATGAMQNARCYAKHPVLYKTPGAIQNTRCYTRYPVLYKIPGAIQDTRCYTKQPLLYKTPGGKTGSSKKPVLPMEAGVIYTSYRLGELSP